MNFRNHLRPVVVAATWSLALFALSVRAEVALEGVTDLQALNINTFLGLADLDCSAPPWLVRWQFRKANTEINTALEALGFYQAQIVDELDMPTHGCWRARFRITPGDPVVIRNVAINVDEPLVHEPAIAARLKEARELMDKTLNHAAYENVKRGLLGEARSLGYFEAAFKMSAVRVDEVGRSASVEFDLVGGSRFVFGDIEIVGDFLQRRLMDAYIPFNTGEPYDASLVSRLRRNLSDSGYFGRTVVVADSDAAVDRAVPVRIELYERPRDWTYAFGVGYATDTGARLRIDADNNLLNERGHRASVKSVWSTERNSLDLQYKIPHLSPLNDWFIFDTGIARLESDTWTSDIQRVGARHSYEQGAWIETDFVDLTYEDYKIGDEFGDSRLLMFGTTLARLWRDIPTRPTAGYRVDGTLRGAWRSLGSDTDVIQLVVGGKAIHELVKDVRVIARVTGGWLWTEDFDALPPSIRFFAGGDASIRGYEYQSVGPEKDGHVVGGERLLTGSLEFDYLFSPNWSVAAFVDSGSAYDDKARFFTGVGGGIRWYSPLGPIRVDVAHPLDDPTTEWRLYVTIGPDL